MIHESKGATAVGLVERGWSPLSCSPTSSWTFLAIETCSKDFIALDSRCLDLVNSQLLSDEIVSIEKSLDLTKLVPLFVRERL